VQPVTLFVTPGDIFVSQIELYIKLKLHRSAMEFLSFSIHVSIDAAFEVCLSEEKNGFVMDREKAFLLLRMGELCKLIIMRQFEDMCHNSKHESMDIVSKSVYILAQMSFFVVCS